MIQSPFQSPFQSPCSNNTQQANLFELQGYDIQITYSTTSITGEPQFSYSDRTDNRSFTGDEITVEDTALGRMVSVQLKNNAADEGLESVTLLLPVIQPVIQRENSQSVDIQTLALFSRQAVFVAPGTGQLQRYNSVYLSGTAQVVAF
jgi:hypothetical protein